MKLSWQNGGLFPRSSASGSPSESIFPTWESVEPLKRPYQHADPTTTLSVVLGGAELREMKQG